MTRPPKRNHLLHLLELNPAKAYLEQYINRVEHNPMTSEQMRAELEAEGYKFGRKEVTYEVAIGRDINTNTNYVTKHGFYLTGSIEYLVKEAYRHLQAQRKMVAMEAENTVLRAFVSKIDRLPMLFDSTEQMEECYDGIQTDAHKLIVDYGITADESDET